MTTVELGKYMLAELVQQKPKTQVWNILNKKTLERLGFVAWHSPWRQYCFFTEIYETVFSHSCLDEIRRFLQELNKKQKEKAQTKMNFAKKEKSQRSD